MAVACTLRGSLLWCGWHVIVIVGVQVVLLLHLLLLVHHLMVHDLLLLPQGCGGSGTGHLLLLLLMSQQHLLLLVHVVRVEIGRPRCSLCCGQQRQWRNRGWCRGQRVGRRRCLCYCRARQGQRSHGGTVAPINKIYTTLLFCGTVGFHFPSVRPVHLCLLFVHGRLNQMARTFGFWLNWEGSVAAMARRHDVGRRGRKTLEAL